MKLIYIANPIAEMDELNARDMAIARYRRRHAWMNEIFNPIALGPLDALDRFARVDC